MVAASSLVVVSASASLSMQWLPKYVALQTFWATWPSAWTTSNKLQAVNSTMVPGPPQDVPRNQIKNTLGNALQTIIQYVGNPSKAKQPALMAANYLLALVVYEATYSATLQTSNPDNYALVQQIGPDLLTDPNTGITSDILNNMTTLITPPVPWWQMNGFTAPVNVLDLVNAGNLF